MHNNKKIGLALSGGGALGAAHIGVIEEIEKAGIKIDYICGVSSGAIVGLIYAMNGIKGLHSFFDQIIHSRIFQKKEYLLVTGPRRLAKFILGLLEKELDGHRDFSQCSIKLACIATNMATGKKEMISRGDAIIAAMASAAYPALMPMQKLDGNYYFDGGVTCSLPCEDVKTMGADFVIGSSIYPLSEIEPESISKMNKLAVLWRTFDIFDKQLNRYEADKCDFCFAPPITSFKIFDFTKMSEIEKAGHEYARANIERLAKLLENGK